MSSSWGADCIFAADRYLFRLGYVFSLSFVPLRVFFFLKVFFDCLGDIFHCDDFFRHRKIVTN